MKKLGEGLYEMTMAEYIAHPASSRGEMVDVLITPAHAKRKKTFPKITTDAMRIGTATHMAFIEPHELLKTYNLFTGKVRRGENWELHKAVAERTGKDPYLTQSQYDLALSMGDALRLNKTASALFNRKPSRREIVIIFTLAGVEVKVRIDTLITDEMPTVADIKTAKAIDDHSFFNSIYAYGYDIQSWLYLKAFRARTHVNVGNFVIIAVEKERNIVVDGKLTHAVRDIDMRDYMKGGEQRALEALSIIADCRKNDSWPAYPDKVERLPPPNWYTKRHGGI